MEARDGIEAPSKVSRPFPFRFGFRATSYKIYSKQGGGNLRAAILHVPFHKVPPPKESMKEFLENRGRISSIVRKTVGSGQSRLTEAAIPRYRLKGRLLIRAL
jgi:hypothetical protein